MPISAPPLQLVDTRGQVAVGMWNAPLRQVDLHRASVQTLPGVPGRLRLKQWQHFAIVHPEVVLTFAVVDAAYMGMCWVQVIDRRTGRAFELHRQSPLVRVRTAETLWNDHTVARSLGLSIRVHNHLDAGVHRVRIRGGRGRRRVVAELDCHHDLSAIAPLVVSLPVGRGRVAYSHKVPLPVSGRIHLHDREVVLDPAECTAILDVHKAHYPRHTWWNWATCVGFDAKGRRIAVNLTRNLVKGDAVHENVIWVDGALSAVGPAQFETKAEPWRASSADGAVDLALHSDGQRGENLRLGVVRSVFVQRYGRFSGTVRVDGDPVTATEWFGVLEDHDAVW